MPGAQCARSPCALVVVGTRSSPQVHRNNPAFPHANGFNGFLRALPGDEFLFVTVIGGLKVLSRPVGLAKTSADLASATDARTTRLRRTQRPPPNAPAGHVSPAEVLAKALKRRSSCAPSIAHGVHPALRRQARPTLPRPPHPIPTFVTMANAPPRDRTAGLLVLICPTAKAKYFYEWGWTEESRKKPSDLPVGQSMYARHSFVRRSTPASQFGTYVGIEIMPGRPLYSETCVMSCINNCSRSR
jgi:hypothetical protein